MQVGGENVATLMGQVTNESMGRGGSEECAVGKGSGPEYGGERVDDRIERDFKEELVMQAVNGKEGG